MKKDYTFHPENLIKAILLTILIVAIVAAIVILGILGNSGKAYVGTWTFTEEGWATQTVDIGDDDTIKITVEYSDEAIAMYQQYGMEMEKTTTFEGTYKFVEAAADAADTGDVSLPDSSVNGTLEITIDGTTDNIDISVAGNQLSWGGSLIFTKA